MFDSVHIIVLHYFCFFTAAVHSGDIIGGNAGEQCNVPLVHFFRQPEWATLHMWRAGTVIKHATQKMQCNWFLGSSASNLLMSFL